jgi:thiamine biosynthesis lipoprotein
MLNIWQLIDDFERRFSRFQTDSELSVLNRCAGEKTTVSAQMREIMAAAQGWSKAMGGLFNPLTLPALHRAGYLGDWNNPTAIHTDYSERQIASADQIDIGEDWVRLPINSAADLGGIGKGYLLDQLGLYLDNQGVTDYWLSLGGDMLIAGRDIDATGWIIEVDTAGVGRAEPIDTRGGRLVIATSGVTKRCGEHNGRVWHHLIDPRTGVPAATDILTATVVGISAVAAEVLAKCLVIGGSVDASGLWQARLSQADANQAILQLETSSIILT